MPEKLKVEADELKRAFKNKWNMTKLAKQIARQNKHIMKEIYDHIEANMPEEIIQGYKYITSVDEMVCERCAPLHGMVFAAIDDAHRPPIHPNCRCTTEPTIVNVVTMETYKIGGKIFIDSEKASDLEYGALTSEDGETIEWQPALGFINRSIKNATKTVHKLLEQAIDKFFKI